MRCLSRNKRLVYYALMTGVSVVTDEYGNETGEKVKYSPPRPLRANVSSAKGIETTDVFGLDVNYDKALVISKVNAPPIDEYSVFWIDSRPGQVPYDYVVKRVSKGLDSIAIALKKVDVDHAQV